MQKEIPVRNLSKHNKARDKYLACIGQKFGRLTIDRVRHEFRGNHFHWIFDCVCECGNRYLVGAKAVLAGNVISCGCYAKEKIAKVSYDEETVSRRSQSLRENIASSNKRQIKLPRHVYLLKNAKGEKYFANYILHGKTIYVGCAHSVAHLMREVAKSKIQNGIWSQKQAKDYLSTWK